MGGKTIIFRCFETVEGYLYVVLNPYDLIICIQFTIGEYYLEGHSGRYHEETYDQAKPSENNDFLG